MSLSQSTNKAVVKVATGNIIHFIFYKLRSMDFNAHAWNKISLCWGRGWQLRPVILHSLWQVNALLRILSLPFENSHSWAQDRSLRLFNPRCTIYLLPKAQVSFVAGGDACHTILPSQLISSFVILEKAWSTKFKMMMKLQEQHWPTERAPTLLWVTVCAGTPFTRSFTVAPTLPNRREYSHL